jgi:hypothetical protein
VLEPIRVSNRSRPRRPARSRTCTSITSEGLPERSLGDQDTDKDQGKNNRDDGSHLLACRHKSSSLISLAATGWKNRTSQVLIFSITLILPKLTLGS